MLTDDQSPGGWTQNAMKTSLALAKASVLYLIFSEFLIGRTPDREVR